MNSKSIYLLSSIFLSGVILLYPAIMFCFNMKWQNLVEIKTSSEFSMLWNTFLWSVIIGLSATAIGWPVGVRISRVRPRQRVGIVVMLLLSLAIPAYAVFYAWWQLWPAGSALHELVVENNLMHLATNVCLFLALVGWSWPIPALFATMSNQSLSGLQNIQRLDGTSLKDRFIVQCTTNWKLLSTSIILIMVFTATNTTCFDLAQVRTIGNEMRAILAMGGSVTDVPLLTISSLFLAVFAAFVIYRFSSIEMHGVRGQIKSIWPVLFVWMILTSGPIISSAWMSLQSEGLQVVDYYKGDLIASGSISMWVVILISCLCFTSICLHSKTNPSIQMFTFLFDIVWLLFAFLPSTLIVEMYTAAWIKVDWVYQQQYMLIFAQTAKFGFIGVLAGKWVVSGKKIQILIATDSMNSIGSMFVGLKPRIFVALSVVIGISLAMSLSEVALTAQLSPPSTNQPVAVALLNAMHYQRPQIVTSVLALIVVVAGVSGFLMMMIHRKFLPLFLLMCLIACRPQTSSEPFEGKIIGGVGIVDGLFVTPRAIDATDSQIVVIDKTGRLQLFNQDGVFQQSWELPLNGMGYPTGVSIDNEGLIWVPETHGNRILVFGKHGELLNSFGKYGTSDGEFLYPTDIAFGSQGTVFISEYGGNDRISRYTKEGTFIDSFGHFGTGELGFKRPQSMAIHPDTGHIFIADSGNHRIVECTQEGQFVLQFGVAGRDVGELLYPYGIEFLSPHVLLITEYGNNRIQLMTVQGEPIGIFGKAGTENGSFKTPWAAVKMGERVLVADTGNNRLQVLKDSMFNR